MTPNEYRQLGYEVFPCAGKRPARCSTWPSKEPFSNGDNVGLVVPVGAVVIDLDVSDGKDGIGALVELAPAGWRHDGPRADTGGGGVHLWFKASPLLGLGNGRGDLPPGIDVRGGGRGYVVAPPSVHPDTGAIYEWRRPLVPVQWLPDAPQWLLERLLAVPRPAPRPRAAATFTDRDLSPYLRAAIDSEAAAVRDAAEGDGNEQINRSAYKLGTLAGLGVSHDEARDAIEDAISGWSWRHSRDRAAALRTFESGWRAGEANPRPAPEDSRNTRSRAPGRSGATPSQRDDHDSLAASRERANQGEVQNGGHNRDEHGEAGRGARGTRQEMGGTGRARSRPTGGSQRNQGAGQKDGSRPGDGETTLRSGGRRAARPQIQITTDEPRVNDQGIAALAQRAYHDLYQRGGALSRVVRYAELPQTVKGIPPNQPVITSLARATLQERLAGAADWLKYDARAKDWTPTHPPGWSTAAIYQRGTWPGIPALRGIADYPLVRADGSFATRPGYDDRTGFYISSVPDLDVPDQPDVLAAREAAERLLDLVCDFPLIGDADRAAWLAYLLTPLARSLISGPTPLFVADATVRATGKTLLLSVPGWILTGRDMPAQTYPVGDEELEKILVSVALLGLPLMCFDNVKVTVGGAVLDKWLTSTAPTGRILGKSEVVLFDWTTVLSVTTNNAAISGDTDRRTIYIKQRTDLEHPETRTGFRYHPLKLHVLDHRPELLSAALTILRAYLLAGSPPQNGRVKGSFEAWARVVRDALLWIGLEDCERAPDDPDRPVDSDSDELAALLAALWEKYAGQEFTVGQLLDDCYPRHDEMMSRETRELRDVLAAMANKGDKPTRQLIGKRLQRYRERWIGDMALFSERDSHRKIQVWKVNARESCG